MLIVGILQTVLLAAILCLLLLRKPVPVLKASDEFHPPVADKQVQILRRGAPGVWLLHSTRPEGHADIQEALATPGLAIRRDGRVEEGVQ